VIRCGRKPLERLAWEVASNLESKLTRFAESRYECPSKLRGWTMFALARQTALTFAVFQLCLLSDVGLISAQVDPKALIGMWEGSAQGVRGSDDRFLVIRSIKPKDDSSWVAQGNYGTNKDKLPRNTFDVSLENGELVLKFVTGAKNPVRLVLKGDNRLEGTIELAQSARSGTTRLVNAPFKLEKVESKPAN